MLNCCKSVHESEGSSVARCTCYQFETVVDTFVCKLFCLWHSHLTEEVLSLYLWTLQYSFIWSVCKILVNLVWIILVLLDYIYFRFSQRKGNDALIANRSEEGKAVGCASSYQRQIGRRYGCSSWCTRLSKLIFWRLEHTTHTTHTTYTTVVFLAFALSVHRAVLANSNALHSHYRLVLISQRKCSFFCRHCDLIFI